MAFMTDHMETPRKCCLCGYPNPTYVCIIRYDDEYRAHPRCSQHSQVVAMPYIKVTFAMYDIIDQVLPPLQQSLLEHLFSEADPDEEDPEVGF